MNIKTWLAVAVCTIVIGLPQPDAQAARMGSGGNIGRTAPSMRPQATPPKPAQPQAAPQPQGVQPVKPSAQPATAAAQPAKRSWLGPLAGLAAGLGLAALASHFGFGEELMSLMLILLAVVAVFAIFRMLAARRQSREGTYGQPAMARSGYGGNELGAEARPAGTEWPARTFGGSGAAAPSAEAPTDVAQTASSEEIDAFMKVAREQFTKLQTIWDSGDIHALAEFCTPEMIRELSHQIASRKGATNLTQVVRLDTEWLGMSDALDDFNKPVDEVQVRFSGLIRESADAAATDFDEVWTLHRAKNDQSGWLVAGITQVQ